MTQRTDAEWLALTMASEANQPHEWPFVGWVIRNRLLVRRPKWRTIYDIVVADEYDFSFFNQFIGKHLDADAVYNASMQQYPGKQAGEAHACAVWVLSEPLWRAPFGRDVLHYWSPVSMVPKGSSPSWAKVAKRTFTPSGVDPQRFVFAAGVP